MKPEGLKPEAQWADSKGGVLGEERASSVHTS